MNYYRIFISIKGPEIYHAVTDILQTTPNILSGKDVEESYEVWGYGLQQDDQDPPIDYINIFLDILQPNFDKIKKIGINRDDISIWRIYEYKEICSMEITPQETKRLGDNGITFCIDCFEK